MSEEVDPIPIGGRETILVIDADGMSRIVAEQVLRHHGYRFLQAANLSQAQLVCGMVGGRVDLAIVDVENTGLPGAQVVARLRQRYPNLRCIFVASSATRDDAGTPARAPLVMKPFGVRTLMQLIRATLDGL